MQIMHIAGKRNDHSVHPCGLEACSDWSGKRDWSNFRLETSTPCLVAAKGTSTASVAFSGEHRSNSTTQLQPHVDGELYGEKCQMPRSSEDVVCADTDFVLDLPKKILV